MKYLSDNFRKNIYSNFECEHDTGKIVSVQEVFDIKQII